MNISNELFTSYLETNYKVFYKDKEIILRVGKHSLEMDCLLEEMGFQSYAFLTAANPYSVLYSEKENIQLNMKLEKKILQENITFLKSVGESTDRTWKEESFCLFGITLQTAKSLAIDYSQNAFLYGSKNLPPGIILCV